jgi:hypothetical protein
MPEEGLEPPTPDYDLRGAERSAYALLRSRFTFLIAPSCSMRRRLPWMFGALMLVRVVNSLPVWEPCSRAARMACRAAPRGARFRLSASTLLAREVDGGRLVAPAAGPRRRRPRRMVRTPDAAISVAFGDAAPPVSAASSASATATKCSYSARSGRSSRSRASSSRRTVVNRSEAIRTPSCVRCPRRGSREHRRTRATTIGTWRSSDGCSLVTGRRSAVASRQVREWASSSSCPSTPSVLTHSARRQTRPTWRTPGAHLDGKRREPPGRRGKPLEVSVLSLKKDPLSSSRH